MIDTLRYANRLKDAGVPAGQAEVMAQALGDTLSENVATRADLDRAVADLKGDIARLDAKFEARFEAMDAKFEARFEAMDAKFEALSRRVEAQTRHVFLALALVVGLGLYNAIAPQFADRAPPAAVPPVESAPDRNAPGVPAS